MAEAPSFKLSAAGYQSLLKEEGNIPFIYDDLRTGPLKPLTSYDQARGTPTIGLGVAIQGEAMRQEFAPFLSRRATPEELERINSSKIAKFERDVNGQLGDAHLSQAMYDALFSLAWNTGPFSRSVKATIEAIKRGDYAAAQQAIASGPTTSKGMVIQTLVKRRAREAAAFAAEGLSGFQAAGRQLLTDMQASPLPYLVGVGVLATATFLLVRAMSR